MVQTFWRNRMGERSKRYKRRRSSIPLVDI